MNFQVLCFSLTSFIISFLVTNPHKVLLCWLCLTIVDYRPLPKGDSAAFTWMFALLLIASLRLCKRNKANMNSHVSKIQHVRQWLAQRQGPLVCSLPQITVQLPDRHNKSLTFYFASCVGFQLGALNLEKYAVFNMTKLFWPIKQADKRWKWWANRRREAADEDNQTRQEEWDTFLQQQPHYDALPCTNRHTSQPQRLHLRPAGGRKED